MPVSTRPPPVVRRSVTLPLPATNSSTATTTTATTSSRLGMVAAGSNQEVETLFTHPSVRIVSFVTASGTTSRASPYHGPAIEEVAGTLPWTSSLERLIDVGPITIYKGPGGVAFLNSRKVMHPILAKSQCWCVDDAARKFVLQIRKPQYWRIELPATDPGDPGASDHLKEIFSQILLFEKTPCPFRRSFTIELPEAPTTPIKKRPWRPVQTPKNESDISPLSDVISEPQNGEYYSTLSGENMGLGEMNSDSDTTDDTNATPRNKASQSMFQPFITEEDSPASPVALRTGRSVTAPPPLKIITSPISTRSRGNSPHGRNIAIESASSGYSSSVESFHTVQSWHSPITPLPLSPPESNPASPKTYPYPHENISLPKRPLHSRETSEITVTPESPRVWEMTRSSSAKSVKDRKDEYITPPPKTPTLVDDIEDNLNEEHFEIATPPTDNERIRHRPTTGSNSRRRALSPLPPAANIFSPSRRRPRHLQTARHLPTAIIQKTCEILLSPPSHLLQLMLDIAAKIAAGEWRGVVFGYDEGGEKVIGQWDYEDDKVIADGWDEDDYGISLSGNQSTKSNPIRERVGRSWEID